MHCYQSPDVPPGVSLIRSKKFKNTSARSWPVHLSEKSPQKPISTPGRPAPIPSFLVRYHGGIPRPAPAVPSRPFLGRRRGEEPRGEEDSNHEREVRGMRCKVENIQFIQAHFVHLVFWVRFFLCPHLPRGWQQWINGLLFTVYCLLLGYSVRWYLLISSNYFIPT